MKTSTTLVLSLLMLTLSACSSAPAETKDTSKEAVKETPAPAKAMGPISLYFGGKLASSVDADGRFLAGEDASEPGKHVATFSKEGVLTFVDSPDMTMTLNEDGSILMARGDGQTQPVPLTVDEAGVIGVDEGNIKGIVLKFDTSGMLTGSEPLPPNLADTRMEGISKVSPRHAAFVFVVTSMFTVSPSQPEPPSNEAPDEPAVAP